MFRTKLAGFILTRDSWLWFWGKLVGVAGLIASGVIQPNTLGLTEPQSKAVMTACAVIIALSAHFATSPLPSKVDAEKVSPIA